MKKKYIVPCHSFWGSLIHMLELVPEHDPSIEEKTQQQPTTTLMIVMMTTYLYLRLCMKNLSMIMIRNKQKIKTKIDPF